MTSSNSKTSPPAEKPVIVIHGGAGVEPGMFKAQKEDVYLKALEAALHSAFAVWKSGADAVDVVEAAVVSMEDCPLFNAGKGSVLNHEGKNELEASIMDGRTRETGAVAGVTVIKNPIKAAAAVMRKTQHVYLIGEGANQFAREHDLEIVDPGYFWTQERWEHLQKKLAKSGELPVPTTVSHKVGTVGAVARDQKGNVAAGTSTGGLTGKRWSRLGDSSVIGCGTFAENESCAVSCTGEGEWFIRFTVAGDVAARVKYGHYSLADAADAVIHGVLSAPDNGEGGLIAIDRAGNFAMPFNSPGMFRGFVCEDGKPHTFVY